MENRIFEIKNELTACGANVTKKQLIRELMKLQSQVAKTVFGEEAGQAGKNVQDVISYLGSRTKGDLYLNELLQKCKSDITEIGEMIKGEQTGKAGEDKAFKSLETVSKNCKILRNVELSDGCHLSEIDLVAVTNSGVFLLEVKNTARNIIIDSKGNYIRIAQNGYAVQDKNIGEQMNEKEYLLRTVLKKAGINNVNIHSLVVFTNSSIDVKNDYPYIKECFLSELPHIVENCVDGHRYSDKTLLTITKAIINAKTEGAYPYKIDMKAFKHNFATLVSSVEKLNKVKQKSMALEYKPKKIGFFQRLLRRFARVACAIFN